jgi:hypothetical protein
MEERLVAALESAAARIEDLAERLSEAPEPDAAEAR